MRIASSCRRDFNSDARVSAHYLVDEDGRFVMPSIDTMVDVTVPDDANFIVRNFIINIQQLKFDKPGQYSIDIALNNRQELSIPLLVKMQTPGEFPPSASDLDS